MLGRRLSLERNTAERCERDNHHQERMLKLLPLTAAECVSSTSETTSEKPKKIQNPPPGHRRSNRAYPRNHALFNARPHCRRGTPPSIRNSVPPSMKMAPPISLSSAESARAQRPRCLPSPAASDAYGYRIDGGSGWRVDTSTVFYLDYPCPASARYREGYLQLQITIR